MPIPFRDVKAKVLQKRHAQLLEEYQAASDQLMSTLAEKDRVIIKRQVEALETEIDDVEEQMRQLAREADETGDMSARMQKAESCGGPAHPEAAQPTPPVKSEKAPKTPSFCPSVDFLLITALAEERDAVLDKLPGHQKLPPTADDVYVYYEAELPVAFPGGERAAYHVIVMPATAMGRVKAATATDAAITRWHPRYVVLVGIAGGLAEAKIALGDILVAHQIVDYELQKVTREGPEVRYEVHQADPRLEIACANFTQTSWLELVRVDRPEPGRPERHIGPIASGDKVVAFGEVLRRYREAWPKLIGVEMEAAGVATAAFQSPVKPGFFMVRCASDLADEHKDSADVKQWRSYACDVAASFAIGLLKSGPVPVCPESTPLADPPLARALSITMGREGLYPYKAGAGQWWVRLKVESNAQISGCQGQIYDIRRLRGTADLRGKPLPESQTSILSWADSIFEPISLHPHQPRYLDLAWRAQDDPPIPSDELRIASAREEGTRDTHCPSWGQRQDFIPLKPGHFLLIVRLFAEKYAPMELRYRLDWPGPGAEDKIRLFEVKSP